MFELTKHRVRQITYRWFQFSESSTYLLFEELYQYNSEPFSWVIPHPSQRGFLLTNFICPDFKEYKGREISFFDSKYVCVYWIPGAEHSAGGYVKTGTYDVKVAGYALKKPLKLKVSKNDQETLIQSVSLEVSKDEQALKGGFIAFSVIEKELECLILLWLEKVAINISNNKNLTFDSKLKELLEHAQALKSPKINPALDVVLKLMERPT